MKRQVSKGGEMKEGKKTRVAGDILSEFLDQYCDILLHIIQFLEPKDVVNVSLVCQNWNNLWGSNCVWLQLFKKKSGIYLDFDNVTDKTMNSIAFIFPCLDKNRLVRKIYGTYNRLRLYSGYPSLNFLNVRKYDRDFMDEFNFVLKILALQSSGSMAPNCFAMDLNNTMRSQELWDTLQIKEICRVPQILLDLQTLFPFTVPDWLPPILETITFCHVNLSYDPEEEESTTIKMVIENKPVILYVRWSRNVDTLSDGSWTLFYEGVKSDDYDCNCPYCKNPNPKNGLVSVKITYDPFWAERMFESLEDDDDDDEEDLLFMHPVNQLAELGRHVLPWIKSESEKFWWGMFICSLSPTCLYGAGDLGPPSLGHFCSQEEQFVNYEPAIHD